MAPSSADSAAKAEPRLDGSGQDWELPGRPVAAPLGAQELSFSPVLASDSPVWPPHCRAVGCVPLCPSPGPAPRPSTAASPASGMSGKHGSPVVPPKVPRPHAPTPVAASAEAPPKPGSKRASIVSHETRVEDKRFTVYKIELETDGAPICVFHRYSEFRELYEKLKEAFPKDKLKFPGKRLIGNNFDPEFILARQRGLNEFVQKVFANASIANHALTQTFFFDQPRHGRGHESHPERPDGDDQLAEADPQPAEEDGRFDLGEGENRKANVEDFTMLKVIGRGSFGKVLLARHNSTNTVYAVKVLNKDAIIKQNEVKHIMSERNVLLGNVKHPFLVGLHFSFQTKTKLYFVLDYVNGGELFFHLQREKTFAVPRALFYAAEITSALGYMHSLNIVYRDLKPENILLDSDGHVRITDFGLVKENVAPGGSTHTFCGTPEYLAPEVLKKHSYGRAVDWWCLGCVTYEMMCGLPPFYSRDLNEMYDRILHDKLRFPDQVPPRARSFLTGLLTRIPDQRLGSGPTGYQDVRSHLVFADIIDWDRLERREMPPPFNPGVQNDLDLKNFDPEFVNEPVPRSVMTTNQQHKGLGVRSVRLTDAFEGFSYVAEGAGGLK